MTRSDDHLLTPEELRLRQSKRRRLSFLLGFILVLLPCAYFGARPARDFIKGWQARRHAHKAFTLIDKQEWNGARGEAVAAYQLRPTEPEALRAIARFLSRTRQAQALEFWDQLSQKQPLARDDLRDEAVVALTTGEYERAARAVQSLVEGKDAGPADWFLAAQMQLQKANREEALGYLQKILEAPASSRREQLQAAVLELAMGPGADSASATRNSEALGRLRKLGEGQDEVALDALVLLAQHTLAARPTAATPSAAASEKDQDEPALIPSADLIHALENHPLAKAPQKLIASDLKIKESPDNKAALIEAAVAQWKESDTDSLVTLARWLNGKGEFQRLLDEIPLEKALGSRELFLQHVDALGALGRWDEIKRLLESERFPLDQAVQRMYLARCNAQLGEKAASENNWKRALDLAAGDLQKLLMLADYSEKNGASEIAATAYEAAAVAAPKVRLAQQGRLRMAQLAMDTKRMHSVLAEMLRLWPNDTAVQNDEAYLRLLLLPNDSFASELPALEQLARDLVKREPTSLPHRTLLALVLLKQQHPADALAVYSDLKLAPSALTVSAVAIHAAVLAANGHQDDARRELEQVPSDRLLPEEQAATAELRPAAESLIPKAD